VTGSACSDRFYLHIEISGQSPSLYTSSRRFRGGYELLVNFIHCCEVVHSLEVYIDFDNFVPAGTSRFEHCCKVLQALKSMLLDSSWGGVVVFIDRRLATEEDETGDLGGM